MPEQSDFQKAFMSRGTGAKLFTQTEFDEALALAQAEIMTVAIQTTKQAIHIEREECARVIEGWTDDKDTTKMAEAIRDRIPSQRQ